MPEHIEHGIDIYQKTWYGNLIIWVQYLSKHMKLTFGEFGPMNRWSCETKKRNFGNFKGAWAFESYFLFN